MHLTQTVQPKFLYALVKAYSPSISFGSSWSKMIVDEFNRTRENEDSVIKYGPQPLRSFMAAKKKYGIMLDTPNALLSDVLSYAVANRTVRVSIPKHDDIDKVHGILANNNDNEIILVTSNIYQLIHSYERISQPAYVLQASPTRANNAPNVLFQQSRRPPPPHNPGLFLVPSR